MKFLIKNFMGVSKLYHETVVHASMYFVQTILIKLQSLEHKNYKTARIFLLCSNNYLELKLVELSPL